MSSDDADSDVEKSENIIAMLDMGAVLEQIGNVYAHVLPRWIIAYPVSISTSIQKLSRR